MHSHRLFGAHTLTIKVRPQVCPRQEGRTRVSRLEYFGTVLWLYPNTGPYKGESGTLNRES